MNTQKFILFKTTDNRYNFTEIRFLTETKSSPELVGMFNVIGSVTFQQTIGENDWYGMRYVIDTTRYNELRLFSTLMKTVNDNTDYKSQPLDVIKAVNGEEHFICNSDFFKVADKGKRCFYVVANGSNYARMVAKDEAEAVVKLNKFIKNRKILTIDNVFSIGESFLID